MISPETDLRFNLALKSCGQCMMCCKLPVIPTLAKPAGKWCVHAKVGSGCTNYADRPVECRSFNCTWLTDQAFGPEWHPVRAKFYLAPKPNGNLVVMVDPAAPHSWRDKKYLAWLRAKGQELLEHGNYVLVLVGIKAFVILPHKEIETQLPPEGYKLTLRPIQNGIMVDFEAVIVVDD